ncbi:hypothetical protein HMPREF2651_06665 [Corynebacterium sp. HMSC063A05]|nr:hypothetical protein HMPREF2651_06665 [Corynebacterium sp. HMSC063A05]
MRGARTADIDDGLWDIGDEAAIDFYDVLGENPAGDADEAFVRLVRAIRCASQLPTRAAGVGYRDGSAMRQ